MRCISPAVLLGAWLKESPAMGEGSSRCPLKPSPTLQLGHSFRNELAIIYASCVAPTYLHTIFVNLKWVVGIKMQSLGNKKMWIVFNTQHSNFNDCPPKCMYTILYIVYLRWAVTIPCMFIAWNPFLHTKKPAHHLQTFRWWESVFCQWYKCVGEVCHP